MRSIPLVHSSSAQISASRPDEGPTRDEGNGEAGPWNVPDTHTKHSISRLDEMEATVKVMENAMKINDWVAISNGE